MEYCKISDNNSFSRIIQGFWRLTEWNYTTDQLVAFMEGCIERGVTTFDTAEVYGGNECERQMGLAFQKNPALRDQVKLVTKMGIYRTATAGYYDTSYDRVKQSCKESLKRLQCDQIDLYLIHREDPCMDHYETARALMELKSEGFIKDMGVSNFDPHKFDALNHATNHQLVTNQIEWNPTCFEHFNSGMMDVLVKEKVSPMIWSPLAGGKLFTSKEEIYTKAYAKINEIAKRYDVEADTIVYAWLLYHPVKALPISGSNQLKRLENAIKALEVPLKHHEWYEIYTASGQQILR